MVEPKPPKRPTDGDPVKMGNWMDDTTDYFADRVNRRLLRSIGVDPDKVLLPFKTNPKAKPTVRKAKKKQLRKRKRP